MPIDPMSAITILKGTIDSVNGFKNLIGEGKEKADLSGHVLELQGKLTEGLAAISNLIQENHQFNDEIRSLKKEIENLEEKFKFKETLVFRNNGYWTKQGDGEDGPFCTGCWDKNKDQVRFVVKTVYCESRWGCPVCTFHIFWDSRY